MLNAVAQEQQPPVPNHPVFSGIEAETQSQADEQRNQDLPQPPESTIIPTTGFTSGQKGLGSRKRPFDECNNSNASQELSQGQDVDVDAADVQDSQTSNLSDYALERRIGAFRAILDNARGGSKGQHVVGLLSTTDNHGQLEDDLGER
jgi:hypothetical protein